REAFFFGGGNKLAVAQNRSGSIVVITGNAKNVHELLPLGPAHVVDFGGVLNPVRGAMLDPQGIGKQADYQAKGKNRDSVDNRQYDARLEIADLVGQALPRVPKSFQVFDENIGHSVAIRLKEGVDERRESRALSKNNKNGGEEHHQDDRQHPPALVARKKGEQLSRNAKPARSRAEKTHEISLSCKLDWWPKLLIYHTRHHAAKRT
ncbi:MAG TPA: hypothetical protein VK728_07740, partial [Candidatus Sulfotelmatobacter sp.]|nr:hypothetical protein [Candidatus Sulfotelmatobacter sp.]